MSNLNFDPPIGEDGKPQVVISVGEKQTINVGDYNNFVIEYSVLKFVDDSSFNDGSAYDEARKQLNEKLDAEREDILTTAGVK